MSKLTTNTWPTTPILVTLLLFTIVALGLAGCGGDTEETTTESEAASVVTTAADGTTDVGGSSATTGGSTEASASAASGVDQLSGDEQAAAIGIARGYLAGQTDFSSGDFEWKIVAVTQDDEQQWWAHVEATPKGGVAAEPHDFFVFHPADKALWYVHGMGTDSEPMDELNVPEEIRSKS